MLPPFDCSAASFSSDGIHFIAGEGERYVVLSIVISKDFTLVTLVQANQI